MPPRSRFCPRRSHRGRARRCASSSPPRNRSRANSRWWRRTEASPSSRTSGAAGRRISGSPKWRSRPPAPGRRGSRATARRRECATISRDDRRRRAAAARACIRLPGSVWPMRNSWDRNTENLYSAWIEKLFDAPIDESPSWPALHVVLRDRQRNLLFNHLGLQRRPDRHVHPSRLRRSSLFPARLFRLQDGPALRLREMHARRRRRSAAMPGLVEHPERGAAPGGAGRHHRGGECCARRRHRQRSSNPFADLFRKPDPRPANAPQVATRSPGIAVPPDPRRASRALRRREHRLRARPALPHRERPRRSPHRYGRRGRPRSRRPSAITCNSASPTAFIPAPAACARSTTAPISIRCL